MLLCKNCDSQKGERKEWVSINGSVVNHTNEADSLDNWCPDCETHCEFYESNPDPEDVFHEKYKLLTNPLDPNAGFDGCMFETYGVELDFVKGLIDTNRVWTILDGSGSSVVYMAGYRLINRLGHLISLKPWENVDEEYICGGVGEEDEDEDEEEEPKTSLDPWDFVIQYFPNYSSSDVIARNNDLHILVKDTENDWTDYCRSLLADECQGSLVTACKLYDESLLEIYEESIKAYLKLIETNP